jgi:MFS family permease
MPSSHSSTSAEPPDVDYASLSLLKQPYFKRFIVGQFSSLFAFHMITIILGWQMYNLTHRALDLGLIGLFQFLPQCLLVLATGYVADHFNRKHVACLFEIIEGVITIVLALGSYYHFITKEMLILAAVLLGSARAFENPALQSLLPTLVPAPLLPRALTWRTACVQSAIVLGPTLGGLLYSFGPYIVYSLCATAFLSSSLCISRIRNIFPAQQREPVTFQTLTGGIEYIFRHPVILGAMSLDLFSVLLGGAVALLPIYAQEILHIGSKGLGLLRAAPSIGALLMSWYIIRHPLKKNAGYTLFFAVAIFGLSTIIFGLSTSVPLSLFALLLSGAADMISVVVRSSLVQLETPDTMRGRVTAVNSIFIGASNQLGEFESGMTAAWLGTVPSVVVGGIGTLLIVVLWMRLFPALLKRQSLQQEAV